MAVENMPTREGMSRVGSIKERWEGFRGGRL